MKRIAFIQTSALGDVLLATAVLRQLRKKYPSPDHTIDWIVFEGYAGVAADAWYHNRTIEWRLNVRLPRQVQEPEQWRLIGKYVARERYDLVCVPQIYPFHPWERRPGVHMLDQMFLNAGLEVPTGRAERAILFRLRTPMESPCAAWPGAVTVNAVCNTAQPVWSDADWHRFAGAFHDEFLRDHPIVVGDRGNAIGDGFRNVHQFNRGNFSLRDWATHIEAAAVHVSYDSGGAWLAATTQTPQIVIYGKEPVCPYWLTSVKLSGVKDPALVHEMFDPTPEAVAAKVREVATP